MKIFKEDNLKEIINYQMELNWYKERYEDLKKIDDWYIKFTTTEEKENEMKEWFRKYIKSFVPKSIIENETSMFILNYWLWIKNGKKE